MTFTQVLSAVWSLFATFLTGTNNFASAYARAGKTVDARVAIWEEAQLAELKVQRETNRKRIDELKAGKATSAPTASLDDLLKDVA